MFNRRWFDNSFERYSNAFSMFTLLLVSMRGLSNNEASKVLFQNFSTISGWLWMTQISDNMVLIRDFDLVNICTLKCNYMLLLGYTSSKNPEIYIQRFNQIIKTCINITKMYIIFFPEALVLKKATLVH